MNLGVIATYSCTMTMGEMSANYVEYGMKGPTLVQRTFHARGKSSERKKESVNARRVAATSQVRKAQVLYTIECRVCSALIQARTESIAYRKLEAHKKQHSNT